MPITIQQMRNLAQAMGINLVMHVAPGAPGPGCDLAPGTALGMPQAFHVMHTQAPIPGVGHFVSFHDESGPATVVEYDRLTRKLNSYFRARAFQSTAAGCDPGVLEGAASHWILSRNQGSRLASCWELLELHVDT